jgi:hypothetical protein
MTSTSARVRVGTRIGDSSLALALVALLLQAQEEGGERTFTNRTAHK